VAIGGGGHPPAFTITAFSLLPLPSSSIAMSSAAYSAQIQNTLMPALAAVREDIARVDGDIAD
jgi:hypothetical protein